MTDVIDALYLEKAKERVRVLKAALAAADQQLVKAEVDFVAGTPGAGDRLTGVDTAMGKIFQELMTAEADLKELKKCLKRRTQ